MIKNASLGLDQLEDLLRVSDNSQALILLARELRVPLATVINIMDLLATDPESAQSLSADVVHSVKAHLSLIDDFLFLSRSKLMTGSVFCEPVEPSEIAAHLSGGGRAVPFLKGSANLGLGFTNRAVLGRVTARLQDTNLIELVQPVITKSRKHSKLSVIFGKTDLDRAALTSFESVGEQNYPLRVQSDSAGLPFYLAFELAKTINHNIRIKSQVQQAGSWLILDIPLTRQGSLV